MRPVDHGQAGAPTEGAEGERRDARALERLIGDGAVFLHDRRVPGTRGNIDHLAVAASGVWIVDVKHYGGKVERRDVGGWVTSDVRLYVSGRDRSSVADALSWQLIAVLHALGEPGIPLTPALCFVGSEWGWFSKPFQHHGVWVTCAKKLAGMIASPGPMSAFNVDRVSRMLSERLPPHTR
jgi:hypothetical protein